MTEASFITDFGLNYATRRRNIIIDNYADSSESRRKESSLRESDGWRSGDRSARYLLLKNAHRESGAWRAFEAIRMEISARYVRVITRR